MTAKERQALVRDIYTPRLDCGVRPDTTVDFKETLDSMATKAGHIYREVLVRSGTRLPQLILVNRTWIAGRAVQYQVMFNFTDVEGEEAVMVTVPAIEQLRLTSLDKAMRCFLN